MWLWKEKMERERWDVENEERQKHCLEQKKECDDDYVKVEADEENYEESIEPSGLWYDQSNASDKKETATAKVRNNEKLLTAAIRANEIINSGYSQEL